MRKDLLVKLVSEMTAPFLDNLLGMETLCLFLLTGLQGSSKPNLLIPISPLAPTERELLFWVDLKLLAQQH